MCLLFPISAFCQKAKIDTFYLDYSDDHTSIPYKNITLFLLKQKATSVEVEKEFFQKDFILNSNENSDGEIDFKKCKFSNTRVISPNVNSTFIACHFKNIQITPAEDARDDYRGFIYIDTMENEGNLDIYNINLYKVIRISGKIKGALTIFNVVCKAGDANIDLTGLRPYKTGQKIKLNLIDAPFSNIKLNYEDFELDTGVTNHPMQACVTYISLLNNFKKRGLTTNYQLLDVEYQHYRYTHVGSAWDKFWGRITDFIEDYWWNYGYNKGRVLLWTLGFLLLFSLFNWPIYHQLNNQIYTVKEIDNKESRSLYDSLIYTCIIFFSVSLDLERLKFQNRIYLAWFILIYLIGLICLAYSINFVMKAGQPLS